MIQTLYDERRMHIRIEVDKVELQNELDEVFPMIYDLELSLKKDVPLEEWRQVSNKLEGVRSLGTELKPLIQPLPYSPRLYPVKSIHRNVMQDWNLYLDQKSSKI